MGANAVWFAPFFYVQIPAMEDTPCKELTQVTANDTMIWQKDLPDYPSSDGWSLSYVLCGAATSNISATPTGTGYLVSVAAPAVAGDYYLQGMVSNGTERHTIYTGTITVLPDLSSVTGIYDGRSRSKRILDALDATIEGRAPKSTLEMDVDGTRLKFMSPQQLNQSRGVYAQKVWREKNPGKIGPAVKVTFGGSY